MKKVAKLIIIDSADKYLIMLRSNHPTFGVDPDLPGGTLEEGESLLETMLREVKEESGVKISSDGVKQIYSGTDYSAHGTLYTLFVTRLNERPDIAMSWEHSAYSWVEFDEFLDKAKNAKDTYMHMVHDVISEL